MLCLIQETKEESEIIDTEKKEENRNAVIKNPLIISICVSQYDDEKWHNLEGAKKDFERLNSLWKYLGWTNIVKNDGNRLTKQELINLLIDDARTDILYKDRSIKSIDGMIICFSGHGKKNHLVLSDHNNGNDESGLISIDEIQDMFSGHNVKPYFLQVPKLIFLDKKITVITLQFFFKW